MQQSKFGLPVTATGSTQIINNNVMKNDSLVVLRFTPLSANALQRSVAQIANDVENTLKHCKENVLTVHCVYRKQHLITKKLSGDLHEALKVCIKSINKIDARPLICRLYAMLSEEGDETFNQLMLSLLFADYMQFY